MAKAKLQRMEDSPDFVELRDGLARLKEREARLEAELQNERRLRDREELAAKMAEGQFDGKELPRSAGRPVADVAEELAVVRRAVQLQADKLSLCQRRLNREICEQHLPQHRELVRDLAAKVVAATVASLAEIQLRDSLTALGLSPEGALRPMCFANLGIYQVNNPNSDLHMWLNEAVGMGYLTGKEPFLQEVGYEAPRRR